MNKPDLNCKRCHGGGRINRYIGHEGRVAQYNCDCVNTVREPQTESLHDQARNLLARPELDPDVRKLCEMVLKMKEDA